MFDLWKITKCFYFDEIIKKSVERTRRDGEGQSLDLCVPADLYLGTAGTSVLPPTQPSPPPGTDDRSPIRPLLDQSSSCPSLSLDERNYCPSTLFSPGRLWFFLSTSTLRHFCVSEASYDWSVGWLATSIFVHVNNRGLINHIDHIY